MSDELVDDRQLRLALKRLSLSERIIVLHQGRIDRFEFDDMIAGRKTISDLVAAAIGYERVTRWRKKKLPTPVGARTESASQEG